MRFIVDEMPTYAGRDCPFSDWKPYPPCFEETGRYICKLDSKKCDRDETECRWMVQRPEYPKKEAET